MTDNSQWINQLRLRQFTDDDLLFLQRLYRTTRESELAMTSFSDEEKNNFIASQFAAQHNHYCENYDIEHFDIIEIDGQPSGRLFIDYWSKEIRIVDIALMPEYRNSGLGTYLLNTLFEKARQLKIAVTIHVERHNPARKLYERLGFKLKSEHDDIYLLMEWK